MYIWCRRGCYTRLNDAFPPPVGGEGFVLANVQLYVNVIIARTWTEMIVSASLCGWGVFSSFSVCLYVGISMYVGIGK